MSGDPAASHEGKCTCGHVRYRVHGEPIFVHCCHCSWCQRETGSAFALNAMIEADRVKLLSGEPEPIDVPSPSGKGQKHWRCPKCRVTVWSNYAGAGPLVHFVRVGTLENPGAMPPDILIYTSTKQPWVVLNDGKPQVAEYYNRSEMIPVDKLERLMAVRNS